MPFAKQNKALTLAMGEWKCLESYKGYDIFLESLTCGLAVAQKKWLLSGQAHRSAHEDLAECTECRPN